MRVERTGSAPSVGGARRTGQTGSAGGFADAITRAGRSGGTAAAAPTTAVGPLTGVDALVALQAVDGDRSGRRRARERAVRILDSLDELRIALLDGRLTEAQLQRLVAAVESERTMTDDPRLNAVLDEIDLRAQVELAKYQTRGQAPAGGGDSIGQSAKKASWIKDLHREVAFSRYLAHTLVHWYIPRRRRRHGGEEQRRTWRIRLRLIATIVRARTRNS